MSLLEQLLRRRRCPMCGGKRKPDDFNPTKRCQPCREKNAARMRLQRARIAAAKRPAIVTEEE